MTPWNRIGLAAIVGFAAPAAFAQEEAEREAPPAEVKLEADTLTSNDATNEIIADGNVIATYEGRVLRADRVIFDRTTGRVHAIGNVQIFDPDGSQRFADEIDVDQDLVDGFASNFSTRLPTGAMAAARTAVRQSDGINRLDKVIYTACPVCEETGKTPTWALRARKATLNQNTQMISYQDAVVEIAGIPVLYFPYFTHPDPNSERRSGLLVPSFGTSSKVGAFYQQPYYQVLSKSSDITISPALYSNVNPLLALDFRKRFYSGTVRIEASVTNEREFDSDGEKFGEAEWRSHVFGEGRFAINDTWQWGFGAERTTDDLYTRRYDISGEGQRRGLYNSQPRILVSQVYAVGQDEDFYADLSVLSFQDLRNDDDDMLPLIAPLGFAEKTLELGRWGVVNLNTSTASLTREDGADSQRVSVGLDWQTAEVLPGGFVVSPFLEGRADYYALDEDVSGVANVSRTLGTVGTEVSWPLMRPGNDVSIMIEPIAMVAWGTKDANDPAIPVEDSLLFELDDTSLFDPSPVPGYDLYEGGGRAAFGVSATADWQGGLQARVLAGRRWREEADPTFDTFSNLAGDSSDYVTNVGFSYKKAYSFDARVRLDPDDFNVNRIDMRGAIRYGRLNAAVRYYRFDERITEDKAQEGFDVGAEVRLTDNVSLFYSQIRDIAGTPVALRDPTTNALLRDPVTNEVLFNAEPRDLNRTIGVAWGDECSRFEIAFTRSEAIDRAIGPNDKIEFRFFLKTLGTVGDRNFD